MNSLNALNALYTRTTALAYAQTERDESIDFLRGMAVVFMTVVHIEYFSAFSLLATERLGFVTAAEWFVILSGLVLGKVGRSRLAHLGWTTTAWKSVARGAKLYLVNVALILIPIVLQPVGFVKTASLTHFVDEATATVYPLYPVEGSRLEDWFNTVLLLRGGPHQAQVLGLYVVLLIFFVPLLLLAFRRLPSALLALSASCALYVWHLFVPFRLSDMQFENAFPVAAWQFPFVAGMFVGWFSNEAYLLFASRFRRFLLYAVCATGAIVMFVLAQGHLDPFTPAWAKLQALPHGAIDSLYLGYAQKNALGPLRLIDDLCLLVVLHAVLRSQWRRIQPVAGWLLVPIGGAALYCFVGHVVLVLIASQVLPFGLRPPSWIAGTAIHLGAIAALWLMARYGPWRRWLR
ncbi:OpgC domain-containing protein [Burkholderia sp. Ac-20353]|uniref:OpgC domain-containing protein n=1 Tax=Burkholderia sp. Ac-20353 TaxID=2703894 RepID=UPI00197C9708|nr:OpgC domain-containing protein [Burkholderia sp. Ac-20353]MBN3788577.1 succinyl transferase OpgC [Burkholderia sp. Ac-20353]